MGSNPARSINWTCGVVVSMQDCLSCDLGAHPNWFVYKMKCKKCKKECDGTYGSGRFCSLGCANTRKHTKETKFKIGLGSHRARHRKYPKVTKILLCSKCNKKYTIVITTHNFNKNKYRKHCSRSCANSKIQTNEMNIKRKKKLEGKLRTKRIKKICKFCKKEVIVKITSTRITCGNLKCVGKNISKTTKGTGKCGGYRKGSVRNYKSGYYKGVWMDSSWEILFAKRCEELSINYIKNFTEWFKYFDAEGTKRKYFPDFYLPDTNQFIEIKGYFPEKERYKLNSVIKNNDINLLTLTSIEEINKFNN